MRILLPALFVLTVSTAWAKKNEHTVEKKPFKAVTTLNAVFLPEKSTPVSVNPSAWKDFTITSLLPQGSKVKKGEVLIGIDTERLDRHIAELEKNRVSAELKLTQQRQDYEQLKINTPRSLANYERADKEAEDNLKWYREIGQAKELEQAKREVTSAERRLSYMKEELKQLEKMYSEDDKTEETEEIILIRTRNSVDFLEWSLKKAKIDSERTTKTNIPRKLKAYERSAKDASIANASAKERLPRSLELKRLALEKAERDDEKAKENLTKLKADREMMNITAAADGVVYYGSIKHGRWSSGGANKVLHIGGKLPSNMILMTLIPKGTALHLSSFAPENSFPHLSNGAKGYAITYLNSYGSFPVEIIKLASHPETDGSYRVTLKPELAKNNKVVSGMKATVKITTDKLDNAIVVPESFLSRADDGSYTVELKLADGKTETRPVVATASHGGNVVISKGLEVGQVIIKK